MRLTLVQEHVFKNPSRRKCVIGVLGDNEVYMTFLTELQMTEPTQALFLA
jgi:hypothetical protein